MIFDEIGMGAVGLVLIPCLQVLADEEYQKRVWVKQLDPRFSSDYSEFFDDFFLACNGILAARERYQLDDKSVDALTGLYQKMHKFLSSWRFSVNGDIEKLIASPDWIAIREEAKLLVGLFQPFAQLPDVIKGHLIPALEKLADRSYQESTWCQVKSAKGETYDFWITDFSAICEFLLFRKEGKIDAECEHLLEELFNKLGEFDMVWRKRLAEDIEAMIRHPQWVSIQRQAAQLLVLLRQLEK